MPGKVVDFFFFMFLYLINPHSILMMEVLLLVVIFSLDKDGEILGGEVIWLWTNSKCKTQC